LQDCMFCFNLKGRRHSVGNAELGKEKYAAVKGAVLQQLAEELGRSHSLKLSVFNLVEG